MTTRVVLLAVDGLDWGLLHTLVDAGRMPAFAGLLEEGASGAMSIPPPLNPAAVWTTVATGTKADRHGVCHELTPRSDGLTLTAIGSEAVREPTLWQLARDEGLTCCVAGWPAVLPSNKGDVNSGDPVSRDRLVAAGFDLADNAAVDAWPLAPGAVWPEVARHEVADALIHPGEVPDAAVCDIVAALQEKVSRQVEHAARTLIARWSSVQALGTRLAASGNVDLLALRFDGLPNWMTQLETIVGHQLPMALGPTYAWLDMIVDHHRVNAQTDLGHIIILSDRGLPRGGYRGAGSLLDAQASGGIVIAGPKVSRDSLLIDSNAIDVLPTVLGLLGVDANSTRATPDGRDLLASLNSRSTRGGSIVSAVVPEVAFVAQDDAALEWLARMDIQTADTSGMEAAVRAVRDETATAWAEARLERGSMQDAIAVLTDVVERSPHLLRARLALGRALVDVGQVELCQNLLRDLPMEALGAEPEVWLDTFGAIVAYAASDFSTAEQHLLRLIERGQCMINAPVWLGWTDLSRDDWRGALAWFDRGSSWPGEAARLYEGMGLAALQGGMYSDAISAFTHAIARQPAMARLHGHRALAYERAGDLRRAESDWKRAIALDPMQAIAVEGLTRTWRQLAPRHR